MYAVSPNHRVSIPADFQKPNRSERCKPAQACHCLRCPQLCCCYERRAIMNLVKWDPFRELEDVSNRLNRVFGRPLVRMEPNEMFTVADWTPSADISETDTAYLIKAEIPGVNKEDVKVTIENGML